MKGVIALVLFLVGWANIAFIMLLTVGFHSEVFVWLLGILVAISNTILYKLRKILDLEAIISVYTTKVFEFITRKGKQ